MIPKDFHRALHTWFKKNGRDFPWRHTHDPYAILVSEFMLQQTTVATVAPYFMSWMQTFPDIYTLAQADEHKVLRHWQGLGYYSRGRNLLHTAQEVVKKFGGNVPCDVSTLRRLPGIGPYTASAIAAFAFDECLPVLDANIIRVLARLTNFKKNVTTTVGRAFLEQTARSLLPKSGGCNYTSALMDLGSIICKAGIPDCVSCPVKSFCQAKSPTKIPLKPPKASLIYQRDVRGFAMKGKTVFLTPSEGPRWKGLWLLPPAQPDLKPLLKISFAVTRHRVCMEVVRTKPSKTYSAFPVDNLPPMPSPHRKALNQLVPTREPL